MASITNGAPNQQRENPVVFASGISGYHDDMDNLDRLTTQAKSLVTAMVANDNMEGLKFETISNLLWLLSDRIDDIESAQAKLMRRFKQ